MTAIAEATQLALLPPLPAQMIGVNIAARYRSATHEASVGGDLYEIIPTGPIGLLSSKPSDDMVMSCDTLFIIGTSYPYAEWLRLRARPEGWRSTSTAACSASGTRWMPT
jgi:hypothetical protein